MLVSKDKPFTPKHKKNLILHVGTHKTGTTSIQSTLSTSADDLQKMGIDVYLDGGWPSGIRGQNKAVTANATGLAHCFIREDLLTPKRAIAESSVLDPSNQIEQFNNFVSKSDADTIVVSSESFCFLRKSTEMKELQKLFLPLFDNIKVIYFQRDVDEWRRSFISQVKRMVDINGFNRVKQSQKPFGDWYFDIDALHDFFIHIGDVQRLSYTQALREYGSVLPCFYDACGIDMPSGAIDQVWLNSSSKKRSNL